MQSKGALERIEVVTIGDVPLIYRRIKELGKSSLEIYEVGKLSTIRLVSALQQGYHQIKTKHTKIIFFYD